DNALIALITAAFSHLVQISSLLREIERQIGWTATIPLFLNGLRTACTTTFRRMFGYVSLPLIVLRNSFLTKLRLYTAYIVRDNFMAKPRFRFCIFQQLDCKWVVLFKAIDGGSTRLDIICG